MTNMQANNTQWHEQSVSRVAREQQKKQQGKVLWYTGLSGSGKSTIANAVNLKLTAMGKHTYLLDGDNIRQGLNVDLGFDDASRSENIRRTAEVAKLFVDAGLIVSVAFICPFERDREFARHLIGDKDFIEVFIDTPVDICEQRDPKGLYKKARTGAISNFTGVDSVYERPNNPEVQIDTTTVSIDDAVEKISSLFIC